MKVKDFMITDVISVHIDTTIEELLKLFVEHRIGGVPVVDDNNQLLGMVSDGDVIRFLSPQKRSVYELFYIVYVEKEETEQDVIARKINTTVSDMMHKRDLHTVKEDDKFEEAITILSKHHFKKLPVLDSEDRVVGLISRGDIIHNLSKMIIELGDN